MTVASFSSVSCSIMINVTLYGFKKFVTGKGSVQKPKGPLDGIIKYLK